MAALWRYGPPVALMIVIFALSSVPHLNSGLGTWDLILRKCAHMTEYALLYLLWRRALPKASPWVAVAIALGYAASDEIHQRFVRDRHGAATDVLIDAAGVAVGVLVARLFPRRRTG